jgi:hypothetical protein
MSLLEEQAEKLKTVLRVPTMIKKQESEIGAGVYYTSTHSKRSYQWVTHSVSLIY